MPEVNKLIFGDMADPREALVALFGDVGSAMTWARQILDSAGISPVDQVQTIAALRKAEPRLRLKPATYLAAQLRL